MLDLGDVITLTYPSMPATPATVLVTIALPDGTTSGPISAPSGSYAYTTLQAGRHTVLWVSTGPSDAYSDSFDVAPQTSTTVISLADAKDHLTITTSGNDDTLRLFLGAVTTVIEKIVGPVIPVTFSEIVDGADTIVLRRAPVTAITSIAAFDPTYGFPLPTYQLDGPAGTLQRIPIQVWGFDPFYSNFGYFYGQRLVVTYTVGRAIIPAGLQTAARMILNELWASRRGAMALPPRGGDESEIVAGLMVNDRVMQLLAPFAHGAGIA